MKKMNIANRLTMFRIFLIPTIMLVFLFPYSQFGFVVPRISIGTVYLPLTNLFGTIIFIVAAATDFLDGYLARKHGLVTTFGKFLDPIADKLLVNTVLLILAGQLRIPIIIPIIMISRDMIVDGIRLIASEQQVVLAASFLGKAKTMTQMLAIILVLLYNIPFELYGVPMGDLMMWMATAISIVSGIEYFVRNRHIILESV